MAPAVAKITVSSAKFLSSVSEVDCHRAVPQTLLQLFDILCVSPNNICITSKVNFYAFLCFSVLFCIFISDI